MYSSSKLIVSRNYFDGDADCYCPHCNAEDADIADLGSGEQPAVMAWNYQQARIDTLVEALEKAQRANGHLREQSAEWERKAISNFEECAKLSQRVEELESRAVTVENLQESAYRAGLTAGWNLGLANNNDGFNKCLAAHAAGIKVEAE